MTSFWRGKRAFITGHTGFKGGWLSLWLQQLGADLVGYSLDPPTEPNLFSLARVGEGMISIYGDTRDHESLSNAIRSYQPEIVFHLAAQAIVRESYQDPIGTLATNIMGTAHLLDAVRYSESVRAVVIITSDKCYENKELDRGYKESDVLGGFDPYSCSKACAELITAAFRNSYFNPLNYHEHEVAVATARAGNVIGGGDWGHDRLVPDIFRSIISRQPAAIRNPQSVRPWQHVLDPLNGYLVLAERLWHQGNEFSEGWNFGPSETDVVSVGELTDCIVGLWQDGKGWTHDMSRHPHEANFLRLDCSKARMRLGWEPMLELSRAIEWTVEWYKAHIEGQDVQSLIFDQINRFNRLSERQA